MSGRSMLRAVYFLQARHLLLRLAQAEVTGDFDEARKLWTRTADAVERTGLGSAVTWDLLGRGLLDVKALLSIALKCTIVTRCGCGQEIDGAQWGRLRLVGYVHDVDGTIEQRQCSHCKSTRSVRIPLKGAA